jgi:hypothetical protein
MPYDVQRAVRDQCSDVIDDVTGFSSGIPAECRLAFGRERIAHAAQVLRNDPEFRSDLAYFLSSFDYFITDSAATLGHAEQRLDGSYVNPASLITD